MAINESGLVVELHRGSIGGANATKIYSRVGVTNTTTETVAWGSGIDTGLTGENVSIALNSSGYCVALHRGTGANSAQHYYRVGQVNASTKTITWGTTTNYDTGGDLAVAMDDSNHVVEVHRGNPSGGSPNNHYYRVGALNPTAKTISWLTGGTLYATGGALSLAVDNSGHCLEVHRGSPGGSNAANHYYQLGTINYTTGVITWGSGTNYDTGGDLDIALTSAGACLEVHRGDPAGSNADNHYYKIGTVNWSAGTVSWSSGALFETGGAVAVAIDNNKNGLNVHRGRDGGSNESEHYAALIKVP